LEVELAPPIPARKPFLKLLGGDRSDGDSASEIASGARQFSGFFSLKRRFILPGRALFCRKPIFVRRRPALTAANRASFPANEPLFGPDKPFSCPPKPRLPQTNPRSWRTSHCLSQSNLPQGQTDLPLAQTKAPPSRSNLRLRRPKAWKGHPALLLSGTSLAPRRSMALGLSCPDQMPKKKGLPRCLSFLPTTPLSPSRNRRMSLSYNLC
jgi:hypothetical protein